MKHPGVVVVGVGPGDPELLTLAAIKEIKQATLVAYPVAREGGDSLAAAIAQEWLVESQNKLPLLFPMVSDAFCLKEAWATATDRLASEVLKGEQIVFLCLGDASLFATGSYVLMGLKERYPDCPVRMVPGVTSFSASAATGLWPLALQQDQLLILATPDEPETLELILQNAPQCGRVIALLKLGSRWQWVRPLLEKMDLLNSALFAQRVGFSDEYVAKTSLVNETEKPYFSLLLIRQNCPVIMPHNIQNCINEL